MIEIPIRVYDKLRKLSKENKPNEVAAFVYDDWEIKKSNTSEESEVNFVSDPDHLVELYDYGIPKFLFHSHPCEAIPSRLDLQCMEYTIPILDCVWLIMNNSYQIRAWTIKKNRIPTELEVKIK